MTEGLDRNEVLALVAAVEEYSEHPIGTAIVNAARAEGVEIPEASEFSSMQAMRNTLADLVAACAGDHRPDCPIWRPRLYRTPGR
ncbi:hypothetical protein [Chelativorans xinjiangense]|uniref:hypothetical protein n=1 Tax=Chelativorans xinjiangense TaxID=2681485 RepID=UPI001359D12C|nr:hypothetical protein [Chelativorans xinjiangense]